MDRPEYIKCVKLTSDGVIVGEETNATWCGRVTGPFEFAFQDASHAALNGRNGGRLFACPDCTKAIYEALSSEQ